VVEHFPARGTNEIWNRGWNAGEVLKSFAQGQRQALQIWTEDVTAQVREFLSEKFSGHDLSRVADAFIHKCTTQTVSQNHSHNHSHEQKKQSRREDLSAFPNTFFYTAFLYCLHFL
jgi:hypothetical protein